MQSNIKINNLFRNLKENCSFPYLTIENELAKMEALSGDEHHTQNNPKN